MEDKETTARDIYRKVKEKQLKESEPEGIFQKVQK